MKRFANDGTHIYMRISRNKKITSFILNEVFGDIDIERGPRGYKINCHLSGISDMITGLNQSSTCYRNGSVPKIKKVIFNPPATAVLWEDGTKTVVKCQEGDTYDKEKGLALAISKKALGNKGSWYETFKKFISPADLEQEPAPADQPKYKVGDRVLIKTETENFYPGFSILKGKIVTITKYDNGTKTNLKYQFNRLWGFEDWIEKKVEE